MVPTIGLWGKVAHLGSGSLSNRHLQPPLWSSLVPYTHLSPCAMHPLGAGDQEAQGDTVPATEQKTDSRSVCLWGAVRQGWTNCQGSPGKETSQGPEGKLNIWFLLDQLSYCCPSWNSLGNFKFTASLFVLEGSQSTGALLLLWVLVPVEAQLHILRLFPPPGSCGSASLPSRNKSLADAFLTDIFDV